jgi:hypothetical protein
MQWNIQCWGYYQFISCVCLGTCYKNFGGLPRTIWYLLNIVHYQVSIIKIKNNALKCILEVIVKSISYSWSFVFQFKSVCKHCKETIRHHHKMLSVETHLRKCRPFKKLMLDTPVIDRPDCWKNSIKSTAQKSIMIDSNSAKSNAPI